MEQDSAAGADSHADEVLHPEQIRLRTETKKKREIPVMLNDRVNLFCELRDRRILFLLDFDRIVLLAWHPANIEKEKKNYYIRHCTWCIDVNDTELFE
jgi:hypothetical protein